MTKLSLCLAQAAPSAPAGGGSMMLLIPYALLFAAMYFLMIAPQRKKQKEHEKMMTSLEAGDEIITTGGIYGTITGVKDDRFVIRIAEGQKIEIGKAFVHSLVKRASAS